MEQYIEFAGNHIWLTTAFFAVLAMLILNLVKDQGTKSNIAPAVATSLINHEDAFILDVRSLAEFKGGHILNSENIPLGSLGKSIKSLEKHKNKPIIAVCRSGSRSASACNTLRKAGFENVHNLRGGILAWESANLPVKRN